MSGILSRENRPGIDVRAWAAAVMLCISSFSSGLADEEKPIAAEDVKLGRPVEFERDIYPILEANCIACHNVAKSESDLVLENAAAIVKGGSAGTAVVAGKPDDSLLFKVAARTEEPVMPPWPNDVQAKKLTPRQLGLLRQWIVEGAAGGTSGKSGVMNWQPINSQLKAIYSVDIDPWGRFIAAGRGGLVTVYDLAARHQVATLADPSIQNLDDKGQPLPNSAPATHRDYVHAVAFHPSGNLLASSGYREVKLWKRATDRVDSRAPVPADVVLRAASGDGLVLAVTTAAPGVQVLDAKTGERTQQIDTDGKKVTALVIVNGERPLMAAALEDGRIQLSDLKTGELRHRSTPIAAPVTTLTGNLHEGRLAALSADGIVRVLTVASETNAVAVAVEIKSEAGPIQQLNGKGSVLLTVAGDRKAEVWNSGSGARQAGMELAGPVVDATVHAEADRAAFVLQDGSGVLWSLKDPKQVAVLNQDLPTVRLVKHAESQKSMRDARSAVLKTKVEESEKELKSQQEAETKAKTELDQATTAAAEAKKKLEEASVATATARKAAEAAPTDDAAKKALEAAEKAETTAKEAATTADNKHQLAKKSLEFAAAAVVRAGQRVEERKKQQQAAQSEAEAATAALEKTRADASTVKVATNFCEMTSDGAVTVTVDQAGDVRLWKSSDGQPLDILPAVAASSPLTSVGLEDTSLRLETSGEHVARQILPAWELDGVLGVLPDQTDSVFLDRVLSLAFSPDGTLLAAGGGEASRQGQLTLWKVADRTLVRQFPDAHSDTVYGVEFSADGRFLASASADKFAKVFEVESGKHVQSYEGHTHHVMDITWKADSTLLASAGADNAIKVWNVETGEQTRTISTYGKQVTSLSFVGLQDNILSSSGDKRVFLHSASDGKTVREFPGNPDYVYRAAATPDGSLVTAGCEDGILRVWNGADGKEVVTFQP